MSANQGSWLPPFYPAPLGPLQGLLTLFRKRHWTEGDNEYQAWQEDTNHPWRIRSLDGVERAVIEPGGTLSFIGKKHAPEETRHRELLERMDRMMCELAQLRTMQSPPPA